MTSENHQTGTDRMHEALQVIDPSKMIHYIVNLQGDLPTINSMALEKVLNLLSLILSASIFFLLLPCQLQKSSSYLHLMQL